MNLGLVAFDVLSLAIIASLWGASAWCGHFVYGWAAPMIWWPVALIAAILTAILALIALCGVLHRLLPRVRPGTYRLLKDPMFFIWVSRFILQRALFPPFLQTVLFQFNTLRFLSLRALGARVSFSTSMSSDAVILDPWLLEAGPGATVGTGCLVSGHFVDGGRLILGKVTLGEGCLLAARVIVAPGANVGPSCRVLAGVMMGVGVTLGERCTVGPDCRLEGDATVDPGVRLGASTFVHKRAHVAEDTEPQASVR